LSGAAGSTVASVPMQILEFQVCLPHFGLVYVLKLQATVIPAFAGDDVVRAGLTVQTQ